MKRRHTLTHSLRIVVVVDDDNLVIFGLELFLDELFMSYVDQFWKSDYELQTPDATLTLILVII